MAPERRRACGIRRLSRNGIRRLSRNGIRRLSRNGISRWAGKGGVALVGAGGQPIGRAALQGAAARRMAVGVARVSILCWPVSRAESGNAGQFR